MISVDNLNKKFKHALRLMSLVLKIRNEMAIKRSFQYQEMLLFPIKHSFLQNIFKK